MIKTVSIPVDSIDNYVRVPEGKMWLPLKSNFSNNIYRYSGLDGVSWNPTGSKGITGNKFYGDQIGFNGFGWPGSRFLTVDELDFDNVTTEIFTTTVTNFQETSTEWTWTYVTEPFIVPEGESILVYNGIYPTGVGGLLTLTASSLVENSDESFDVNIDPQLLAEDQVISLKGGDSINVADIFVSRVKRFQPTPPESNGDVFDILRIQYLNT